LRPLRDTLARNTVFNALGRVWEALLGLVLMAYALRVVGDTGWGLWSLVAVFTGYAALFDVGVGSGFSKYIAERAASDPTGRGISAVVSAGFFFYAALGALMVGLGWFCIDAVLAAILALRSGPAASGFDAGELRFLFRGALILFAANNGLAPFAAVPVGLQRMGLGNAVAAAGSMVKAGATVFFLASGHGVAGLLYAAYVAFVFQAVSGVAVALYLVPDLRIGPQWTDRYTFGQLFHFGWRAQVARLANVVNFQTDRAVVWALSRFGQTGPVGMYAVAESVAAKMRQLPGLLVSAMVPAVSDLDARGEEDRLRELYLRSTKYMAATAVPMAVYFMGGADMLIRVLAGAQPEAHQAAWVLRILVVGYLFNLLPAPGVSVVLGKGRADVQMYAGLISMAVNIVLTIAAAWAIGFYGIPIGTSAGMAVSTLWFFHMTRRLLQVPLGALFKVCLLWPCCASLPGGAVCVAIQYALRGETGLAPNAAGAALAALVLGASYGLLLGRLPFLDRFDADFLMETLQFKRAPGFALLTRRARHV